MALLAAAATAAGMLTHTNTGRRAGAASRHASGIQPAPTVIPRHFTHALEPKQAHAHTRKHANTLSHTHTRARPPAHQVGDGHERQLGAGEGRVAVAAHRRHGPQEVAVREGRGREGSGAGGKQARLQLMERRLEKGPGWRVQAERRGGWDGGP